MTIWMAPYSEELLNIRKTKSLYCLKVVLKVFQSSESYSLTCKLTSSRKYCFKINPALNQRAFESKVLFNLNDLLLVLFVKICIFMQNPFVSMLNNQNDGHFEESSAPGAVNGTEQMGKGKQKPNIPRLVTAMVGQLLSSTAVTLSHK